MGIYSGATVKLPERLAYLSLRTTCTGQSYGFSVRTVGWRIGFWMHSASAWYHSP